MIKSMTGFGRSEQFTTVGKIRVELRTLNSRFTDIVLKLPSILEIFSDDLKRLLKERFQRGRIEVMITLEEPATEAIRLDIDQAILSRYYQGLQKIRRDLGIGSPVTLQHLIPFSEMYFQESYAFETDQLQQTIRALLDTAIVEVEAMRCREGEHLTEDIEQYLHKIENKIESITDQSQALKKRYFEKVKQTVLEMTQEAGITEDRMVQEAALMAKKVDITEECARIVSHIKQFRRFLKLDEPVGKRMNFLTQEMFREVTTIGAKAEDADISHLVVDLKNELEKIKEQVHNIL